MKHDADTYFTYRLTTDPLETVPAAGAPSGEVNAGVVLIFALAAGGGLCALLMAFIGR